MTQKKTKAGIKSTLVRPLARQIHRGIRRWSADAVGAQQKVFEQLIKKGKKTAFGKDHKLNKITSYEAFRNEVPIRDYEGIKPYIERIKKGEKDGPVFPR